MKQVLEKLIDKRSSLYGFRGRSLGALDGFTYIKADYRKPEEIPVDNGWEELKKGTRFHGDDVHYWFHKKFRTCKAEPHKKLQFNVSTYPETGWLYSKKPQLMIFLNGKLEAGMDMEHRSIFLDFDTEYDMYAYFYIDAPYGGTICSPESYVEFNASLSLTDERMEKLLYDFSVPLDAAIALGVEDTNARTILKHLNAAIDLLDVRKPGTDEFYESAAKCDKYLEEEFYGKVCGGSEAIVGAIGHTHIDVAWLWTYAQTAEKAQRSFATVVHLMERYPEYKFMSSQPALYKYVKIHAPALYEKIKELVKQGRWEVEGAMWLEADCNLTSGEGLVRQVLFGKRFMKEEFDVDSHILWLPDVFGYSVALPQILRKSGVDKFVTSKISWSQYNKFPYDTFMWQGLDGTEIFSYFLTAQNYVRGEVPKAYTAYNATADPKQIIGTWNRYQQKEYNNEVMLTFGWGDGGGGPEKDMLEKLRRLSYGIPGVPKTEMMFAAELLDHAEKNFNENCKLMGRTPKWVGELYLEHHRGTYTSISKNKKNNRQSEFLYLKTETLSALAKLLANVPYKQEQINDGWETILLAQFHDVLPGTSIKEVYQDTDKMYAEVIEKAESIIDENITAITNNIKTDGGLWVYNPHSFEYSGYVENNGEYQYVSKVPSFGYKVVKPEAPKGEIKVTEKSIENRFYKIEFDENANIISLYDKENDREVVKDGSILNQLVACDDTSHIEYDAWETGSYIEDVKWNIDDVKNISVINEGGRAGLLIEREFLNSTIVQKVLVYENDRRIDFPTEIDWHNQHIIVKAMFPVNVHASNATYEVQFGNYERPTHQNTSWDAAKFEVCAHKWADISDGGYGVSLINDCKYGHSAEDSTIKLTLLKSATWPDNVDDQGKHEFTYSLYPHKDDFRKAGTVKEGYKLNQPIILKEIGKQ
ncbi:MAG: alpha-mannosidase, partial [Clostridia bacterium]|nr:alpha-mannosidase [Clostridia bacterium]